LFTPCASSKPSKRSSTKKRNRPIDAAHVTAISKAPIISSSCIETAPDIGASNRLFSDATPPSYFSSTVASELQADDAPSPMARATAKNLLSMWSLFDDEICFSGQRENSVEDVRPAW
jgi:hypothetical protein